MVDPAAFGAHWNAAQAIAGIQLAIGANSPFFFGRELWRETRIALFEQTTDTRPEELKAQGVRPRVWFGERWITSIFDLFEENVRYFPSLLPVVEDEDPVAVLESGGAPRLQELRLHNGTIYRWNRPIYDIARGRPHLRVENRVLPAGPTIVDTLANAAFYYGLVRVLVEDDRPIWTQMSFSAAEDNFYAGARDGIDARVYWPGVGEVPGGRARAAPPAARWPATGCRGWGVDAADADRLLEIIERRCVERSTARPGRRRPSTASTRSLDRADALREMTVRYRDHMHSNEPVHTWPLPPEAFWSARLALTVVVFRAGAAWDGSPPCSGPGRRWWVWRSPGRGGGPGRCSRSRWVWRRGRGGAGGGAADAGGAAGVDGAGADEGVGGGTVAAVERAADRRARGWTDQTGVAGARRAGWVRAGRRAGRAVQRAGDEAAGSVVLAGVEGLRASGAADRPGGCRGAATSASARWSWSRASGSPRVLKLQGARLRVVGPRAAGRRAARAAAAAGRGGSTPASRSWCRRCRAAAVDPDGAVPAAARVLVDARARPRAPCTRGTPTACWTGWRRSQDRFAGTVDGAQVVAPAGRRRARRRAAARRPRSR